MHGDKQAVRLINNHGRQTESIVTRICGNGRLMEIHSFCGLHLFLPIKLLDNSDGVGNINADKCVVGVTSGQAFSRADKGWESTCFDLDRTARHFQRNSSNATFIDIKRIYPGYGHHTFSTRSPCRSSSSIPQQNTRFPSQRWRTKRGIVPWKQPSELDGHLSLG